MEQARIEVELIDNRTISVPATEINMKAFRNFLKNSPNYLGLMGNEAAETFVQYTGKKSIKFIRLVGLQNTVSQWFDEFNDYIV